MRITPIMQQACTVLAAQQQQIQDLQVSLANASVRGPSMPIPLGLAASAAPEKCETEMSSAAFKSWRRSMGCWLQICHWPSQEAVHHIRLHCAPELQRALDARFTDDQWRALSTEEALDAIGKLVLRASNKAAQYQEFFSAMQGQEESISNFFLKCNQKALDCEFNCPNCSGDLTEYMLLHKLMVSLSYIKFKRYVFQSCNKIHSVDALRAMCSAFQAARQNLEGGTGLQNPPRAASASVEGNPEREVQTDVASVRTQQPSTRACGNCGGRHAPGRASCPAKAMPCHACKKIGHLKKFCRSVKKREGEGEVTPLVSGAITLASVCINSNRL